MASVRLITPLTPDLLQHPEIRPLLGKTVEIIIQEVPEPGPRPLSEWQPLLDAGGKDLVDPEAYRQLREADLK